MTILTHILAAMAGAAYRRYRLFLNLLWREVEPRSCGIPDLYRAKGRISWRLAWEVAKDYGRDR